MNKNQANQYVPFFAYDTANQIPFTGGTLANFTVSRSLNGAPDAPCTAPTITETGGGYYAALLTSAGDTNGDVAVFTVAYSGPQTGISIDPIPIYQMFPANFGALGITAGGHVSNVDQVTGDVAGKVLGGGASVISGTGAWSLDGSGNAPATASALATLQIAATNLNNLSALANLFYPTSMVRPGTGSIAYPLTFVVKDSEGNSIDVDGNTVTLTATNAAGTDRSVNLSAVTHSGTGEYKFTYTVTSAAADEGLRVTAAGTADGAARKAYANIDISDADSLLALAAIQAQTDKLAFDGANNVKSTPQTGVTVTTSNDKTGYALSGAGVTAVQTGIATAAALAAFVAQFVAQFTGITSLADWLRAAFRNSAADATAVTEINSGGGSYDPTEDSLQALAGASSGGGGGATADELVAALTSANLPVVLQPAYDPDTGVLTLVRGRDYKASEGRAVGWTSGTWPDLSPVGTTVALLIYRAGSATVSVAGTILDAGSAMQSIQFEPTHTDLTIPPRGIASPYVFEAVATFADGDLVPLVGPGACVVAQNAAP
jgi:hypothetical protein